MTLQTGAHVDGVFRVYTGARTPISLSINTNNDPPSPTPKGKGYDATLTLFSVISVNISFSTNIRNQQGIIPSYVKLVYIRNLGVIMIMFL